MRVCWAIEEEVFCIFFASAAGRTLWFVNQFEFMEISV